MMRSLLKLATRGVVAGRALLPAGIVAAFLFLGSAQAYAGTYTVDTTLDGTSSGCVDATPNDCTLRGAISKANTNAGPDTIILPPGIYRLTLGPANENANAGGDLDVLDDITIIGAGGNSEGDASQTVIQSGSVDTAPGAGFDKVISINPNWDKVISATIQAVTVRYGNNPSPYSGDGMGGGIDFEATPYNNPSVSGTGSLTLHNVIVTQNKTTDGDGGGISAINGLLRAGAHLTITNSVITGNSTYNGDGGGIQTASLDYTISGTTVSGNISGKGAARGGYGGGISTSGAGTISNSTISGNTGDSTTRAGGMYSSGALTMTNVTISGNAGGSQGGGLWAGGATTLTNVTITGNSAAGDGGGIWTGTITLNNTLVAGNTAAVNYGEIRGTATGSNNLVGTGGHNSGLVNGVSGNKVGIASPGLDTLKDNGGRVQTHALLSGSPAIDGGNGSLVSATTDARGTGYARTIDGDGNGSAVVDIGAFELQSADLTIALSSSGPFSQSQANAGYSLTVTNVGTAPSSGAVTVSVTLPSGLSNPRLSGTGWTCNNGTVTCSRSDALSGNSSYPTITLLVDVAANAPASVSVSATVSMTGEANALNNSASNATTVRQQTATAASDVSAVYGSLVTLSASVTPGVPGIVSFSASGLGNIGSAAVSTGTGTASTSVLMAFTPGAYTLTATFTPTDTNYLQSSDTRALTISKAPLTITADSKSRTYGAANPTLTVSYSGFVLGQSQTALAGSLSVGTTATASSAVGSYPITASGYTSDKYQITYVDGTLTVNPAPLTIRADDKSRLYGAANPAFTAAITGFVLGETEAALGGALTFSTPATVASAPGTYTITPSGYTSTNYMLTYQNGSLTVGQAPLTITAENQSRTYGAANPAFTVTYAGFVLGESEAVLTGTLSVGTAATTGSPVGAYPITASGLSSANYQITYQAGSLTVSPAPLTVKVDDASRLYGDANPAFTFTATGLVNGDTAAVLTGTPGFTTGAVTASTPGTYAVTLSGLVSANYAITYQSGSLTVTQRPLTISADAKTKTYGAANPALTVTYSGFAAGQDESVLSGTLSLTTTAGTSSPVGSYPITASGYTSTNYAITYVPAQLTVTPAPLTIRPADAARTYGAANPAFAATYTGLVLGETEAVLTGSLSLTTGATGASPAGTYPITAAGLSSTNYVITYVAGTLTVNPAPLTITAQNASRAYGSANPAFSVSYSGFVLGETETVLSGTLSFTAPGAATAAGLYAIDPGGLTSANYAINFVGGTLTITKAPVVVTASDATRAYGAADPTFTAGYAGLVNGETAAGLGWSPAFTTTAVAASVPGTYTITPGGLVSNNYSFTYVDGTLTVTKAALTVKANDAGRTYGVANPAFTVSYTGFVLGETEAVLGGTLAFSTAATAASPVGTYPVTPAGLTAANYVITYADGTLTVGKAPLTVTAADAARTYGAANPAFTASYSGFLQGDTEAVLTGSLSFATTAVTASPAGTYPITPSGLDAANYAITYQSGTLTVARAPLTVTAVDQNKAYGFANPPLTVLYSGFVLGQNESVLGGTLSVTTPATAASPVGTYAITPAGLTSADYAITFVPGTLTVTPASLSVTADNATRTYGGAAPSYTASYSGLTAGDTPAALGGTLTFSTTATAASPVGTYPITPSGLTSPNYIITFYDGTLTVTEAPLTVSAVDKSKVYGEVNPVLTAAYTGFVLDDDETDLAGSLSLTTPATQSSGAGTYAISVGGLTSSNYAITFVPGTLTVTKAPLTATAEAKTKVYGSPNPDFTVGYTGFVLGEWGVNLTGTLTFTTAATDSSPVGSYTITPSGLTSDNYDITFVPATLTVTKAPLTVTAVDQTKVYGSANPPPSALFSGFVLGQDATVLGGTLTITTPASVASPAGTYAITPAGLTSNNYNITFVPGTLTVTQAPLTVTADPSTKLYGAANPSFTAAFSGFVLGETATVLGGQLTYTTTATEASPTGTYTVTPGGLTSPNYAITFVPGTLTVTQAPLTVKADDKVRVFGVANPVLTASYTGLVLGETAAVLGGTLDLSTTATAASPVGAYPISISGLTSTNYAITFVPGTLTVTNATLTIRAESKSRVYGEPNPALTATYTGFVGGDTPAVLSGTLSLTTAAVTNSPVGTYAITPSGLTAANYLLVFEPGTLTVTPRTLYVSADDASREYGSPNPPLTGTVTGAASGDNITGHFSTAAGPTSPAGQYGITASAAASAGSLSNYTVVAKSGRLTVHPAPLTVRIADASRTYGEENPTFQAAVTGLKNGDQVGVTLSTTATASSGVGTYPITGQVTGSTSNYTVTVTGGTLTVRPASLTVTADDAVKLEGEPNPPLKGSVTGVRPGDAIHATFTTTATRDSSPGTYPITPELRDPKGMLRNYTVTAHQGTLTVTGCDAVNGTDGDRPVTRNRCRSSQSVEEEVGAALISTTTNMVQRAIDHARETGSATPPRLVVVADQEAPVTGGIVSLPSIKLLAGAGGELQVQTRFGSLLVSAQTLQQFAGGHDESRLVILFQEAKTQAPADKAMKPASPVIEVTIAILAGDGTVTEQRQFLGGLVLNLPVSADGNGKAPDLELAGIYHVVEDENGQITAMEYIGGEVDEQTGRISAETDHLSKYGVVLYDREYDDVVLEHWAYRAVKVMTARHVVKGVSESLFDPDRPVTRAEFSAMIARAFRVQALPVATRPFADVAPDAWHAGIMKAVVEAGLFTPEPGNLLRPDVPITREEMAVVIARAMERFYPKAPLPKPDVEKVLSRFRDQAQVSQESRDEMARLVESGLVKGRAADTLAPQGTTTRAEAVTLIKRLSDWGKQKK